MIINQHSQKLHGHDFVHMNMPPLLDFVLNRLPSMRKIYFEHGNLNLREYVDQVFYGGSVPVQDEIFHECVFEYVEELLGTKLARKTQDYFNQHNVILTANHHGPDFQALTFQGTLMFSLFTRSPIIPVFAFGNVPLNNQAYARGVTLSRHSSDEFVFDNAKITPPKLNIFPDKRKRTVVSVAPNYDVASIHKLVRKLSEKNSYPLFSVEEKEILNDVLQQIYLDPLVLKCKGYSAQSVLINHLLWKKLFSNSLGESPDLIFLEIEHLVAKIICRELESKENSIHSLFFNEAFQADLIRSLDGVMGCWNIEKLESKMDPKYKESNLEGEAGTVFFWGVDQKGRKFSLSLKNNHLVGKNDSGNSYLFPFHSESLKDLLKAQTIIPSMFTCFYLLSFIRGITCVGGFSQSEYLTQINTALEQLYASFHQRKMIGSKTDKLIVGMIPCIQITGKSIVYAEGLVDMLMSQGMNQRQEFINNLSVKRAIEQGVIEVYPEVTDRNNRVKDWHSIISSGILSS